MILTTFPPRTLAAWSAGPSLEPKRSSTSAWSKAGLDFVLALLLLALTAPLLLLAAVLIKLTSRGPAFATHTRVGKDGRSYTLYKLRTHTCGTSPHDPPRFLVGWLLRRTHLDALPQMWNVLRGQMSLVGPRPERPELVEQLEQLLPCYRERLRVRPGITGLAQVQFPDDTDLPSIRRKLACDLYYVQRTSFWLDVRLLLSSGLHLARVPFPVARKLLRVPSGKFIEWFYETLEAHAEANAEPAPA